MDDMKKILVLCALAIFLLSAVDSNAKLTVKAKSIEWNEYVSGENFPYLESNIAVRKDGELISVDTKNIIIYEKNLDGVVPFEISNLKEGYQTIKWYPQNVGITDTTYKAQLVVTLDGESAVFDKPFNGSFNEGILLKIADENIKELRECVWPDLKPINGNKLPIPIVIETLYLDEANKDRGVILDSITIEGNDSGVFFWERKGTYSGSHEFPELPTELIFGRKYVIWVWFEPKTWEAESATLFLHYEGGLTKRIPLFANESSYPKETIMELIQPNGGEILTPCQEYEIKWRNHSKSSPVFIFFSEDGGHKWEYVDIVNIDSTYIWTVPPNITPKAKIKVTQDLSQTSTFSLSAAGGSVRSVAYNSTGSKAAAATKSGMITDYNLYPSGGGVPIVENLWSLGDSTFTFDKIFGVEYLSDDTLVVAYDIPGRFGGPTTTHLAYTYKGHQYAENHIKIDGVNGGKKLLVGPAKDYMVLISKNFSPQMKVYNPKTATEIKSILFDSPVMDVELNDKLPRALVSTMSGMIYELSVPDFEILRKIDLSSQNIPICIGYAPNGNLLSLGYPNQGGLTDNFLFDIEKNTIVTPIRVSGSDPVEHIFSPDSRNFLVGSQYPQQLTLADLSDLSNMRYLKGHLDAALTDVKFAPDAHSIISSSASGNDNFKFSTFSFPDYDESDTLFNIVPVDVETPEQILDAVYMGTEHEIIIDNVCNIGGVDIVYNDLRLAQGVHFKLNQDIAVHDTLLPGECGYYKLSYFPYTHGEISDTLIFTVCDVDYEIVIRGTVYPRDIQFFTDMYDFGEVCLFESETYSGVVLTNNDPAPLIIDRIALIGDDSNQFYRENIRDTVLQAYESLEFDLKFKPTELGEKKANLKVYHSKQETYYDTLSLKGTGIGTYVEVSHKKLLFIPEIDTRELRVINIGDTPIDFENISLEPEGYFKVLTKLPLTVASKDTLVLEVRQIKETDGLVEMLVNATPCLVQSSLYLGQYRGHATVLLPDIEVDAHSEFNFEIKYRSSDTKGAYQGERFYEGELTVNPRLMMPIELSSPLGRAEFISNIVEDGLRKCKFRVEGDFGNEGILAKVKAVPGIAETDYSEIGLSYSALGFGEAVTETKSKGSITVTGTKGRKVFRPETNLSNMEITPNPANEFIDVQFEAEIAEPCTIEIINSTGKVISTTVCNNIKSGVNTRKIITSSISTGNYTIRVYTASSQISSTLIIQR